MQVKVCPKCGTDNKITNASCSNCYSTLEGVATTLSKRQQPVIPPVQPVQPNGPAQQQTARPASASGAQATPPSPYGPPPGPRPGGHMPPHDRPQPVEQGSKVGVILLILLLLGGGAFAAWWFLGKADTPEQVVQRFIDASRDGDYARFKSCLTEATAQQMVQQAGSEEKAAEQMKNAAEIKSKSGSSREMIVSGEATYEGDQAVVPVGYSDAAEGSAEQEFVCTNENGKWKVDLTATIARLLRNLPSGRNVSTPQPPRPQQPPQFPKPVVVEPSPPSPGQEQPEQPVVVAPTPPRPSG